MDGTLCIPGANKSSGAEREGTSEHNKKVVRHIVKNIPQQYLFQNLRSFSRDNIIERKLTPNEATRT